MDYKEVIEKVERYSQLVAEVFKPKMIILYGSYAKGSAREDSDIDVAVVFDNVGDDYLDILHKLYKLRRQIDSRIEPVLSEPESDKSGFYEDILKTGKVIREF